MQAGEYLPDPTVAMDIEIFGLQELCYVIISLWVDEHRP
jgi:hypothetical protein